MTRSKRNPQTAWHQHFVTQAASGLTTAAYLKQQDISSSTWYKWHKVLLETESMSSVRPSEVDNSSGREPHPDKVGLPPGSKRRAGGGNSKC